MHGLSAFGPDVHAPLLQRGHTSPAVVRNTSEKRSTVRVTSPVCRFDVPVGSFWKRLVTQTGTLAARSGRGGPNTSVLIEPTPVGPLRVQTGLLVVSQSVRQSFRFEPPTTGKLCDVPVHPLSRSVPLLATVTVAMLPPPAGFAGHFTIVVMGPLVHRSTSVSGSFFGLPSLSATTRIRFTPGLFCFLPLSGTENDTELPQLWVDPSAGAPRPPVFDGPPRAIVVGSSPIGTCHLIVPVLRSYAVSVVYGGLVADAITPWRPLASVSMSERLPATSSPNVTRKVCSSVAWYGSLRFS